MEERLEKESALGKIFGENFKGSAYRGVRAFDKKLRFFSWPFRSFTRGEISNAFYNSGVVNRIEEAEKVCDLLGGKSERIAIKITSEDYYIITPHGRERYKLGYATTNTGPR